jgi:hypothetical protein
MKFSHRRLMIRVSRWSRLFNPYTTLISIFWFSAAVARIIRV